MAQSRTVADLLDLGVLIVRAQSSSLSLIRRTNEGMYVYCVTGVKI